MERPFDYPGSLQGDVPDIDWTAELKAAERDVGAARSGDLQSRLAFVRSAVARLALVERAIEAEIDE